MPDKKLYSKTKSQKILHKLEREYKKETGKDLNRPFLPLMVGLATGAVAAGVGYGAGMRTKKFLNSIDQLPSHVADEVGNKVISKGMESGLFSGLFGGGYLGGDYADHKKYQYAKKKGIELDLNLITKDRVKKLTPEAKEKYLNKTAFIDILFPMAGRGAADKITSKFTEDERKRYAAKNIGTVAGIGAATLAAPWALKQLYKSKLKSHGFNYNKYTKQWARGPVTNMDDLGESLGVKFKKGKFYDMDGNQIKTKKEMKKKYRSAAKKHHPDRGGSKDEYIKAQKAYENIQKTPYFDKLSYFITYEYN